MNDTFTRLSAPFSPDDLEWRAGATNRDKTRALALPYITSRAVMDRLDQVLGPDKWKDQYLAGPDGGVLCGLSLLLGDQWITKWDGAQNTNFEEVKGGLSNAFKRAAVKWGIGRYLYRLPKFWVPCEAQDNSVRLSHYPDLPSWALPGVEGSEDRTDQILAELGFDDPPAPRPDRKPSRPPRKHRTSGDDGARRSWRADQVNHLVSIGLAKNPRQAVNMLNLSNLSPDASPQECEIWAAAYLDNRTNGIDVNRSAELVNTDPAVFIP